MVCFDSNEDGKDSNGDGDDVGSGQEEDENYDD